LRWYTDCCRTPIANTAAGPRFPVIGMVAQEHDHPFWRDIHAVASHISL